MKKEASFPLWQIFLITIVFLMFIELAQLVRLRALYLDSKERLLVTHTLQRLADEEGWFLSDFSLMRIDRRQMQFMHIPHHRGYDPSICYFARYSESSPPIKCHAL